MSEQEQGGDAYEFKQIHTHIGSDVCRSGCPGNAAMQREKNLARQARRLAEGAQTQNERGEWVPAIPTPWLVYLGVRCDCGRKFWSIPRSAIRRYREHYAYAHILGMESTVDPRTTARDETRTP